jgi:hypothetical protein
VGDYVMLTSKEKEFLENNRSLIESRPSLTHIYNKVAFDLGIISGKKLSVLYAEAVGWYIFRVRVARISIGGGSPRYRFLYNIESLSDKNDRLRLGDDYFDDAVNPSLEFQRHRLVAELKKLDRTFDLHSFKNLFDSAQYSMSRN